MSRAIEKPLLCGGEGPCGGSQEHGVTKHVVRDPAGGIVIIANSLPNMVGADMLGNVRGASC